MSEYRVTKYDPALRDERGAYLPDEWIGFSQVGKRFDAGVLTLSAYLAAEDAYVESIRRFMAGAGVERLVVSSLEFDPREGDSWREESKGWLAIGAELAGAPLESVIRATLRGRMWCLLEGEGGFYVHFGDDYYSFVGRRGAPLAAPSVPAGMFIEPFVSPYWPDPDET